jgi:threonine synthase
VRRVTDIVSLGEALTPLVALPRTAARAGASELIVKDEGRLPTGSFKARGLALAVSMAKALGIEHMAMPTNGNAGAALAAYASHCGIKTTIFCPEDTPEVNVSEIALQGGNVYRVNGLIDDCGKIVAEGKARVGWFDTSTLKEPYRIEGKKTLGLEIAEQLGWRVPDAIVYPAGGGVGIIGIWRALWQLREIGWISGELPRLIVTQAAGCAPLVKAFEEGREDSEFWEGANTIAAGLRVPKALGDFLLLRAVRETGGTAVAVSDEEIIEAIGDLGRFAGIASCPEGAATVAAARVLVSRGELDAGERVVVINTGSGLKYPEHL